MMLPMKDMLMIDIFFSKLLVIECCKHSRNSIITITVESEKEQSFSSVTSQVNFPQLSLKNLLYELLFNFGKFLLIYKRDLVSILFHY